MECWFALEGSVKVRDNEKSRAILKELRETSGEMSVEAENDTDGFMTITFSNGTEMANTSAENFTALVQGLGRHTVESFCLIEEFSAERGELWVGSESQIEEGKRLAMIQEARIAIRKLTPEDRQALLGEFQK
jgi:hypothetical protein